MACNIIYQIAHKFCLPSFFSVNTLLLQASTTFCIYGYETTIFDSYAIGSSSKTPWCFSQAVFMEISGPIVLMGLSRCSFWEGRNNGEVSRASYIYSLYDK